MILSQANLFGDPGPYDPTIRTLPRYADAAIAGAVTGTADINFGRELASDELFPHLARGAGQSLSHFPVTAHPRARTRLSIVSADCTAWDACACMIWNIVHQVAAGFRFGSGTPCGVEL
jgi:hypothetical protein